MINEEVHHANPPHQAGLCDLGGYRASFDAKGRSANCVTQSMLTADGHVIG